MDELPSFRTHVSFLDANAQAHDRRPLFAFGDLCDNSLEAGSTLLDIDVLPNGNANGVMISMTDDGKGMDEKQMSDGLLSVGFTTKGKNTEVHYGMGSTSAQPRLSPKGSLIFSKRDGSRTVGLISSTLFKDLGTDELKTAQCSWDARTNKVITETSERHPLKAAQRQASLAVILAHTPFRTESALLEQFRRIPGAHGTRLLLLHCDNQVLDTAVAADDVVVTHPASGGDRDGAHPQQHEVSLRSFLEVLYYADSSTAPPMQISLRGHLVPPRRWDMFLLEWPEDTTEYTYKPAGLDSSAGEYGASIRFGLRVPLRELHSVFTSKHVRGSDRAALQERKAELQDYTGVFYYNHGRLIRPLERTHQQLQSLHSGNILLTAEKKVTLFGIGTIGVCREGWLLPTHSKSEYAMRPVHPSAFYRGGTERPDYPQLQKVVDKKLIEFLSTVIAPRYNVITAHQKGMSQRKLLKPPVDQATLAASKATALVKRKEREKAVAVLDDGVRACVRADRTVIGTIVCMPFRLYKLKLPSGQLHPKCFRAADLEVAGFDPVAQLPPGARPAPRTLEGAQAEVAWFVDSGGQEREFYPCTLRSLHATRGAGWFYAEYQDNPLDNEALYIALASNQAGYLGFRENGVLLEPRSDLFLHPNQVEVCLAAEGADAAGASTADASTAGAASSSAARGGTGTATVIVAAGSVTTPAPFPTAACACATNAAPKPFAVGARVLARFKRRDRFFPGVITAVNHGGSTLSVRYDDGDEEDDVRNTDIKPVDLPPPAKRARTSGAEESALEVLVHRLSVTKAWAAAGLPPLHSSTDARLHALFGTFVESVASSGNPEGIEGLDGPHHVRNIDGLDGPHHARNIEGLDGPHHARNIEDLDGPHHARNIAARWPRQQSERDEETQSLTADEARAAAAAEGLELVPSSSNESGFKGVRRLRGGKYELRICENGKQHSFGSFTTPEEAALCYARYAGTERAASEAAEAMGDVSKAPGQASASTALPAATAPVLPVVASLGVALRMVATSSSTAQPVAYGDGASGCAMREAAGAGRPSDRTQPTTVASDTRAAIPPAGSTGGALERVLAEWRLPPAYADALRANGFDGPQVEAVIEKLCALSPTQVDELAQKVHMKPGHALKFRDHLHKRKSG
jgi:hypothetical protein